MDENGWTKHQKVFLEMTSVHVLSFFLNLLEGTVNRVSDSCQKVSKTSEN